MDVLGYTENGSIHVEIDGILFVVPDEMANRHRREVAEWEAAGNTIPPYVAPEPGCPAISRRQMLLGLLSIGITGDMVEAELQLIEDAQEREAALIEWRAAGLYERAHPLVDQLASAFSLPAPQVDDLWRWAGGL